MDSWWSPSGCVGECNLQHISWIRQWGYWLNKSIILSSWDMWHTYVTTWNINYNPIQFDGEPWLTTFGSRHDAHSGGGVAPLCEGIDATEAKLGVSLESSHGPDSRSSFAFGAGVVIVNVGWHGGTRWHIPTVLLVKKRRIRKVTTGSHKST